jgi:Leucine-rich repeat (LRR) protein
VRQYLKNNNEKLLQTAIYLLDEKVNLVDVRVENNTIFLGRNKQLQSINFLGAFQGFDIDLSHTRVTNLEVFSHKQHDYLDLSHTPLWDLTPLESTDMKGLNITNSYVSSLWPLEQTGLEVLKAGKNKIELIPEGLMKTIKVFDISRTMIKKLPDIKARNLEVLDCSRCPLMITEQNVQNLVKLKELNFSEGQIGQKVRELLLKRGVKLTQSSSL